MFTANDKRVFWHRFRGGVRAEVVVDPKSIDQETLRSNPSGRGSQPQRILKECKRWTLMMESTIANETSRTLMHVFMLERQA